MIQKKQRFPVNILMLSCILMMVNEISGQSKDNSNNYEITFSQNTPLTAHVRATISVESDTLYVHEYGAWAEKRGWATFVKNLKATTLSNENLKLKEIDKLKWIVKSKHPTNITIEYDINFPYADPNFNWSSVIRSTAGFYDGEGLFLLARTLFVYNSSEVKTTVEFMIPTDWKVTAPWQSISTNKFVGNSLEVLMDNAIVVGKHNEYEIEIDNFTSSLVILGYNTDEKKQSASLMIPVYKKIMSSHLRFFDYNNKNNYLMVWFPDGNWQTGEGFQDSYVLITPNLPQEYDRPAWANSIAHETFHYWNGHKIESAEYQLTQWFSEGFTDYVANLTLVRNGIITERQFLNYMQKHFMMYINYNFKWGTPYKRFSLTEVGEHKSSYNAAVYDGGWTASFCLDVLIRHSTNNEFGLEDVFLGLYKEYQLTKKGYTNQKIIATCKNLTGVDIKEFFNTYIEGKKMIPIEDYLKKSGFEGSTTIYGTHVEIDYNAGGLELDIRSSILD